MNKRIAVIGAGVSGLTSAVLFAEHGYLTTIFADEASAQTTSAAAGAIWFPYDVEPFDAAIKWALESYRRFDDLADEPGSGISLIELRQFCRSGQIEIPDWANKLGASFLTRSSGEVIRGFTHGFSMTV